MDRARTKNQQPTRDHRIGGLLEEILQMMIMSVPVCHESDGGAVWRSREVFRVVSCVKNLSIYIARE
jgi:hypothetical protein